MTRVAHYVQSVTDADHEHVLGLEKSYVRPFLLKKKWFSGFTVFPHSSIVFSTPLKNGRSREHCIYNYIYLYFVKSCVRRSLY
jgi:hypothetical protein